jgi:hypothetical protein
MKRSVNIAKMLSMIYKSKRLNLRKFKLI